MCFHTCESSQLVTHLSANSFRLQGETLVARAPVDLVGSQRWAHPTEQRCSGLCRMPAPEAVSCQQLTLQHREAVILLPWAMGSAMLWSAGPWQTFENLLRSLLSLPIEEVLCQPLSLSHSAGASLRPPCQAQYCPTECILLGGTGWVVLTLDL